MTFHPSMRRTRHESRKKGTSWASETYRVFVYISGSGFRRKGTSVVTTCRCVNPTNKNDRRLSLNVTLYCHRSPVTQAVEIKPLRPPRRSRWAGGGWNVSGKKKKHRHDLDPLLKGRQNKGCVRGVHCATVISIYS